jgi:hypothetical protein
MDEYKPGIDNYVIFQVSLSQLLNTHVPTVWAIDQYRIYKEVSSIDL